MLPRTSRALYLIALMASLSIGVYVVLTELNSSITFFYTPTEISQLPELPQNQIRVGGFVKPGSIAKKNKELSFIITDCAQEISVEYHGNASPLFREKQGIVAIGTLMKTHLLIASAILTKHDENYKPKTINSSERPNQDFCKFNQKSMK